MAGTLKVFRTPIGFHDAYVAAPSRKAALAAWGSDADLFARGMAELVTDPALTAAPLATPGIVVKRSRGTAAEQIAALPPDRPRKVAPVEEAAPTPKPAARPKPRPDRGPVEQAERALAEGETRHRAERDKLAQEEARLTARRRALEQAQEAERARLQRALDEAADAYAARLRAWRG